MLEEAFELVIAGSVHLAGSVPLDDGVRAARGRGRARTRRSFRCASAPSSARPGSRSIRSASRRDARTCGKRSRSSRRRSLPRSRRSPPRPPRCRGRPRTRARPRRSGRARDFRPRRDLRPLPARSALRALGEPGCAVALHDLSAACRSLPCARAGCVAVGPDARDRGRARVRGGARRAHRGAHERGRLAARGRRRARARHLGGERAVGRGHEDVHDGSGGDRRARARTRGERPGGRRSRRFPERWARLRPCPTSSSDRPLAHCSMPRRRSASRAATPTRRRSRRRSSSRRSPGCGPRASARPTCATARARPLWACRRSSSTRAARSPATSTDSSASSPPRARRSSRSAPAARCRPPRGCCEELAPIALIVPAQLVAERLAVLRGRDPDRPPGLTKVTRTH